MEFYQLLIIAIVIFIPIYAIARGGLKPGSEFSDETSTPNYDWVCRVCDAKMDANTNSCTICLAPASISKDEIIQWKENWKNRKPHLNEQSYKCGKCGYGQFESGAFRASGGSISASFDLDNKQFFHISCKQCGYTEFYKGQVPFSDNLFDAIIGQ